MQVRLDAEARALSELLARPVRAERRWGLWQVIQRCLACNEEVSSSFDSPVVDQSALHATLFDHYDGHRCARDILFGTDEELDELYARTESESLRLAEHAATLKGHALTARVERESELLAIWAMWLSRQATQRTA